MAHYHPVVFAAGRSIAGESLGFHAYSLRVDNCSNQWYLEESTVSFIPPYSLGMCLRLYGTAVAILLAQPPVGQPQPAPIAGEQVVGVYSDQLRTEVAGVPIRNFSLVQTVSDLTEGPEPATPPAGVDRLWADTAGNIHHLHADTTDRELVDPSNANTLLPLGGDIVGFLNATSIAAGAVIASKLGAGAAAANVGALGGVLTGLLPNPGLAAGAVTQRRFAAATTSSPSAASGGFVDIPDPQITLATSGGDVFGVFLGTFSSNTAGAIMGLQVALSPISAISPVNQWAVNVGQGFMMVTMGLWTGLSAATYTFKGQMSVNAGTITAYATSRYAFALELKA